MVTASPPATSLRALLARIAEALQLPAHLDVGVRQHYEALASYISGSELSVYSPSLYAQGSFRIATTVKPVASEEFDLDFICELILPVTTSAQSVYELVAKVIERNGNYNGKVERKPRCIRVTFADQCHVDIVPAIPDAARGGTFILIPEQSDVLWSWKSTNPKGYVSWFTSLHEVRQLTKAASVEPLHPTQDADAKSPLQVGVQLLKRNHQIVISDSGLRTPSIVHTTIADNHAAGRQDVVDAFEAITVGIASYSAAPRHVLHPANPEEVISEKWNDPEVFSAFSAYTRTLGQQWAAVRAAKGRGYQALAPLLYKMFGEAPVQTAVKALAQHAKDLGDAGRLRTAVAGGLAVGGAGLGNPRKTFYGRQ